MTRARRNRKFLRVLAPSLPMHAVVWLERHIDDVEISFRRLSNSGIASMRVPERLVVELARIIGTQRQENIRGHYLADHIGVVTLSYWMRESRAGRHRRLCNEVRNLYSVLQLLETVKA